MRRSSKAPTAGAFATHGWRASTSTATSSRDICRATRRPTTICSANGWGCTSHRWSGRAGRAAGAGTRPRQAGFEAEALLQNAPDGVNREQALYYHHEVADMMLLAGLAARARGTDFCADLLATARGDDGLRAGDDGRRRQRADDRRRRRRADGPAAPRGRFGTRTARCWPVARCCSSAATSSRPAAASTASRAGCSARPARKRMTHSPPARGPGAARLRARRLCGARLALRNAAMSFASSPTQGRSATCRLRRTAMPMRWRSRCRRTARNC